MRAEQISIFLENTTGRLAEVTGILARAGVNIRALSVADTSDFGVLRLIVDDNEKARASLSENGFTVGKTHVVAVEIADKPGGLHHILEILDRAGVNIEYMYAFVQPGKHSAIMIFRFDRTDEAISVLQSADIPVIAGEKLYTL